MPVEVERCTNCGAPLRLDGVRRCEFCQTPLALRTQTGITDREAVIQAMDPSAPLEMQIDDVFDIKGKGVVVTGRIRAGSVRTGDVLLVDGPKGQFQTTCAGIEMFRKRVDAAAAGDNVGVFLEGVKNRHDILTGGTVRSRR